MSHKRVYVLEDAYGEMPGLPDITALIRTRGCYRLPLYQDRPGALAPLALAHDAEAFGDLGIGLHQPAEIAAEAVLVELLVRLDVPKPAGIGGQLVRHHDAHEVVFPQPPVSILKSTRRMPTPRNRPDRKSLTRMASAMMSSISCGVAQPNAVMCSSDTIGSPS